MIFLFNFFNKFEIVNTVKVFYCKVNPINTVLKNLNLKFKNRKHMN